MPCCFLPADRRRQTVKTCAKYSTLIVTSILILAFLGGYPLPLMSNPTPTATSAQNLINISSTTAAFTSSAIHVVDALKTGAHRLSVQWPGAVITHLPEMGSWLPPLVPSRPAEIAESPAGVASLFTIEPEQHMVAATSGLPLGWLLRFMPGLVWLTVDFGTAMPASCHHFMGSETPSSANHHQVMSFETPSAANHQPVMSFEVSPAANAAALVAPLQHYGEPVDNPEVAAAICEGQPRTSAMIEMIPEGQHGVPEMTSHGESVPLEVADQLSQARVALRQLLLLGSAWPGLLPPATLGSSEEEQAGADWRQHIVPGVPSLIPVLVSSTSLAFGHFQEHTDVRICNIRTPSGQCQCSCPHILLARFVAARCTMLLAGESKVNSLRFCDTWLLVLVCSRHAALR